MDISLPSENLTGAREKSTTTLFYQLIDKIRSFIIGRTLSILITLIYTGKTYYRKSGNIQCSLLLRGRRHGYSGPLQVGPESALA